MVTALEMMTTDVCTVGLDTGLKELAELFSKLRVSGFPVVDKEGKVVGVVTETDLIHQNERLHIPTTIAIFDAVLVLGSSKKVEDELKRMAATTVAEVMSPELVTVPPEATLGEIATIMGEKGVHTIPVVDAAGNLLGVVGKLDLIRAMAK